MPRTKTFSDGEFKTAMQKSGNIAAKAAEYLECSIATVYQRASQLGIKTTVEESTISINSPQIKIMLGFDEETDLDIYSGILGKYRHNTRYAIMRAVGKAWTQRMFKDFPRPLNPHHVRVFNTLRKLSQASPSVRRRVDDIMFVIETIDEAIPEKYIVEYHEMYLDHQIAIKAKFPVSKVSEKKSRKKKKPITNKSVAKVVSEKAKLRKKKRRAKKGKLSNKFGEID